MSLKKYARIVLVMCALAGLLYNSWPLGYWLNPSTARFGLASDLDNRGQPFDWLFIVGDLLVGACLIAVCVLMKLKLSGLLWSKAMLMLLVGLVLFGLFTATSAAAPSGCTEARVPVCARFDKRLFKPDGIESSIAALGLFASLIAINIIIAGRKVRTSLSRLAGAALIAWPASVILFLTAASANREAHLVQQILLIIAGLALLIIGLSINEMIDKQVPAP